MNRKGMERFLGRMEWVVRPHAGTGVFLFGAYCAEIAEGDGGKVPFSLICPLLTAVAFAVVPQSFDRTDRLWRGLPMRVERHISFLDAAPRSTKGLCRDFGSSLSNSLLEIPAVGGQPVAGGAFWCVANE